MEDNLLTHKIKIMLERATYRPKRVENLPAGANIIKTDISVDVEEIENGYLTTQNYEVKYELNGEICYFYKDRKFFSKTNPMKFDDKAAGASLADNFE